MGKWRCYTVNMPARIHPTTPRFCKKCNKLIERPLQKRSKFRISWFIYSKRQFCSALCQHKGRAIKGSQNPNWRGGKSTCQVCKTILATRYSYRSTKFCKPCWYQFHRGQNHTNWKEKVGYKYLHKWIIKVLGQPTKCEFCGRDGLTGRKIHWANKSCQYLRDRTDWLRLCAKCHKAYDKKPISPLYHKTTTIHKRE